MTLQELVRKKESASSMPPGPRQAIPPEGSSADTYARQVGYKARKAAVASASIPGALTNLNPRLHSENLQSLLCHNFQVEEYVVRLEAELRRFGCNTVSRPALYPWG